MTEARSRPLSRARLRASRHLAFPSFTCLTVHGLCITLFSSAISASTLDVNNSHRYSDVHLVSDPILSGYRLQLTYKLYHTAFYERSYDKQSATSLTARHKDFKLALAQWRKLWQQSGEPELLAYMLDNNYSHNLNISALEQSDQHKAQFLKKHCVEEGFCLYLTQMESVVNDNEDRTFELKEIVDLDGSVLLHDVNIDEERLVQADWFDDRDSGEGDTQCYHGWSDECECDHHFEDTVCCKFCSISPLFMFER